MSKLILILIAVAAFVIGYGIELILMATHGLFSPFHKKVFIECTAITLIGLVLSCLLILALPL